MSNPIAIGLGLLAAASLAQAAETRAISHLRINLSTPEQTIFEAVSAAALPQCLALSSSVVNNGGPTEHQLHGDCYGVTTPPQAEALRRALHKAMGKGPGSLNVDVVWKFETSSASSKGEHTGHGAGKKPCPDCEGR